MPRKAARPCSFPGCPRLVTNPNRRYCDEHQAQEWKRQDANRGTAAERGYDDKWRIIRGRFLKRNPVCVRCGAPATVAHLIIRRRDGGQNSDDNLLALCQSCHSQLHAQAGESFRDRG